MSTSTSAARAPQTMLYRPITTPGGDAGSPTTAATLEQPGEASVPTPKPAPTDSSAPACPERRGGRVAGAVTRMTYQKRGWWYVNVPLRDGGRRAVALRHQDADTAEKDAELVRNVLALPDGKGWEYLEMLTSGRCSFATFRKHKVELSTLAQVCAPQGKTLTSFVSGWESAAKLEHLAPTTISSYRNIIRRFIASGHPLTHLGLRAYLGGQVEGRSFKTTNYHAAALRSFCSHLVSTGRIAEDPMVGITGGTSRAPSEDPLWLTEERVEQVGAELRRMSEGELADFFVIINGTGADLSALMESKREDVDTTTWEILVRGSKRTNRKRRVPIPRFARKAVMRRLKRAPGPEDRLFRAWKDRHRLSVAFAKLRDALVTTSQWKWLDGYTLRDARHTFAVRHVQAGTDFQTIARMLGNANATHVIERYGMFNPDREARAMAEKRAERFHAERKRQQAARPATPHTGSVSAAGARPRLQLVG